MRGTGAKKKTKRRGGRRRGRRGRRIRKTREFLGGWKWRVACNKRAIGGNRVFGGWGGANMAKNFEKNSAKKEREVGASNLINFFGGLRPSQRGFFFFLDLKKKKKFATKVMRNKGCITLWPCCHLH